MNEAIVWIHGDCLTPHQPALVHHPHAPAIFVWDDALLQKRQISLKRILFIYESLLDLPVTIRRGRPAAEIAAFAAQHDAQTVITMTSISPGFARIAQALQQQGLQLQILQEEPFITLQQQPDLRRFSRYWRAAQKQLKKELSRQ